MKKLIFTVMLAVSALAHAEMWTLTNSYFTGQSWMCTYRLSSGNYTITIQSVNFCQQVIFQ